MEYLNFPVRVGPRQAEGFLVRVELSPAGDGEGRLRLPWTDEDAALLLDLLHDALRSHRGLKVIGIEPASGSGERQPRIDPAIEEFGGGLFDALFSGQVLSLLDGSLGRIADAPDQGLRILLRFDVRDPELALLASLPWEFLYDRRHGDFLCFRRKTPLVRYLEFPQPLATLPVAPPLRILVAISRPVDFPFLDLETERKRLEEVLRPLPGVQVTFLPRATPEAVRDALIDRGAHVLHFMGHGAIDAASGEGQLIFEGDGAAAMPLGALGFARLVTDAGGLRLVFLNACETARASRSGGLDPFTCVATTLVQAGVPAALAMQFPISDRAAIAFSAAFYRRLVQGDPLDAATVEGRQAIYRAAPESHEWGTPVLFQRAVGDLVLLPRSPVEAQPIAFPREAAGPQLRDEIIEASRYITEKTTGFVGREWLLDRIDQFTQRNRCGYFLLLGDPGIGKTALLARLVRQHGFLHHFNLRAEGIHRAETFLVNLCAQLICVYGLAIDRLPPVAGADSRFFRKLLDQVAQKLRPHERAVLLVDALDEAESPPQGTNPLYLPMTLPEGVFVVMTARRGALGLRIDCPQEPFELSNDLPDNTADLRRFLDGKLNSPKLRAYLEETRLAVDAFAADLIERADGNFMYLRHVVPEIENGDYSGYPLDHLPRGLENYYEDHWRRMRARDEEIWFSIQLPVLAALAVAEVPISARLIGTLTGLRPSRVVDVLERWAPFLHTSLVPDEERAGFQKRYRLYHASFRDFLVAKEPVQTEGFELRKVHDRIGDLLLEYLPDEGE